MKALRMLANMFTSPKSEPTVNDEINGEIMLANAANDKTHRSGNVLWIAHPSTGIRCIVFSKTKDGIKEVEFIENRFTGIPYRSCPLSLLNYAPQEGFFVNPEWRKSVREYWAKMNVKIKKGSTYQVIGNPNVNQITVKSLSWSNAIGECLGNSVKVSKLQLGSPIPQTESI